MGVHDVVRAVNDKAEKASTAARAAQAKRDADTMKPLPVVRSGGPKGPTRIVPRTGGK